MNQIACRVIIRTMVFVCAAYLSKSRAQEIAGVDIILPINTYPPYCIDAALKYALFQDFAFGLDEG